MLVFCSPKSLTMKKLLLGLSVIYLFAFSNCNGKKQPDPPVPKTGKLPEKIDSLPKRVVYLDPENLKKWDSSGDFAEIKRRFEGYPKPLFTTHHQNFFDFFNTARHPIQSFVPPTFSIYDKYLNFQRLLGLRNPEFMIQGVAYKNKVRVYPAIDQQDVFYLVFIAEKQKASGNAQGETSLGIYFKMKDVFEMIPLDEMIEADNDIRKFQSYWADVVRTNPTYTFYNKKSCSYSIADYNELLGPTSVFWNVTGAKTDPASKLAVRIYPVIDTRDRQNTVLRLVLKLTEKTAQGYSEIQDKEYFDNMDPCPTACPTNSL